MSQLTPMCDCIEYHLESMPEDKREAKLAKLAESAAKQIAAESNKIQEELVKMQKTATDSGKAFDWNKFEEKMFREFDFDPDFRGKMHPTKLKKDKATCSYCGSYAFWHREGTEKPA